MAWPVAANPGDSRPFGKDAEVAAVKCALDQPDENGRQGLAIFL